MEPAYLKRRECSNDKFNAEAAHLRMHNLRKQPTNSGELYHLRTITSVVM